MIQILLNVLEGNVYLVVLQIKNALKMEELFLRINVSFVENIKNIGKMTVSPIAMTMKCIEMGFVNVILDIRELVINVCSNVGLIKYGRKSVFVKRDTLELMEFVSIVHPILWYLLKGMNVFVIKITIGMMFRILAIF